MKNVQYVGKSEVHHVKDQIVNKMFKKHLVDFSIIIFIFLIDRVSKLLIISTPETYEQYGITITSFLNFAEKKPDMWQYNTSSLRIMFLGKPFPCILKKP